MARVVLWEEVRGVCGGEEERRVCGRVVGCEGEGRGLVLVGGGGWYRRSRSRLGISFSG